MGIRDEVARRAAQAKSFVTGKKDEAIQRYEDQRLEQELKQAARQAGDEIEREETGESRAGQIARRTKSYIQGQFSPTFKNAVGYKQKQVAPAGKMKRIPDSVNKNIPRTRVPVEPQKTSFINRQIDLSYNQGQGYTSNVVSEAFRWKQFENKRPKPIGNLPSLQRTFEDAVGFKPKKEKKPIEQRFTITVKPVKRKP